MLKYYYTETDFGKYVVKNREDADFNIVVLSDVHSIVLCDLLNKYDKELEYKNKVIDKCIRNDKLYNTMIMDKDYTIEVLKKEKRILKDIIHEKQGDIG